MYPKRYACLISCLFILYMAPLTGQSPVETRFIASPQPPQAKIHPSLLSAPQTGEDQEILIVLREQIDPDIAKAAHTKAAKGEAIYTTARRLTERTQTPLVALLQSTGRTYRSFFLLNALYTVADAGLIQRLAAQPTVAWILPNPWVELELPQRDLTPITSRSTIEWGIERINADDVWQLGYTGQGIVIGGQDTGYEWDHPVLKTKYRGWSGEDNVNHNYNWHDAIHRLNPLNGDTTDMNNQNPCGLNSPVPCDDHSHGTHTMGTMVGDDGMGNQVGVAPGARWIGCRNMERGWGSPASYIECFQWFIAPTDLQGRNPRPDLAPHVINNSWGCPPVEGCDAAQRAIMQQVVETVRAAGIVVVVSAGNSGPGCSSITDPAAIYDASFTVGAIRPNDTIASFSSRGPVIIDSSFLIKPDVVAPGVAVRSAVPGGGFASWNGTSMAGPHVAGAVALLLSARPDLIGQVDSVERILRETTATSPLPQQECDGINTLAVPNSVYGYGRIDVLAAVEQALLVDAEEPAADTQVRLFPNPTSGIAQLQWSPEVAFHTLLLYDAQGRLLQRRTVSGHYQHELDMSTYPAGLYSYRLLGEKKAVSGRLVVGR